MQDDRDRYELDITSSFEVPGGINAAELIGAVRGMVENEEEGSFMQRLIRADNTGEWLQIGCGSEYPDRQFIVLGDDDLIRVDKTYTKITVRFKPGSASGTEYSIGYKGDFGRHVLDNMRKFCAMLKERIGL